MASSKWGGDESKLPKWAQSELFKLRQHIVGLEQQLAIAMGEAPAAGATGRVIADNHSLNDGFPLHDRAVVKFQIGPRKYDTITCALRKRGDQTVLDVNAQSGLLVINPQAANAANLTVGE